MHTIDDVLMTVYPDARAARVDLGALGAGLSFTRPGMPAKWRLDDVDYLIRIQDDGCRVRRWTDFAEVLVEREVANGKTNNSDQARPASVLPVQAVQVDVRGVHTE